MNIALYARVSTKQQAEEGVSLDVQATEFQRWVTANHPNATTFEYVEEGVSGRKASRPKLDRLLADLDGIDVVCVYRGDRLSRDQLHRLMLAQLIRKEAELVWLTQSFDDSPEGRFMENLDGSLAQLESDRIAFRTRVAMRRLAERGELLGLAPYGYRNIEGGWEIVPDQAEVVRRIDRMYLAGNGWTKIKNALNKEGIPAPGGGAWRTNAVEDVLKRPIYTGLIRHGSHPRSRAKVDPADIIEAEVSVDSFVPIRDRDTWLRLQSELSKRATGKRPGSAVFSGTLRCGVCGGSMLQNGRGLYVCTRHKTRGTCEWNSVNEGKLLAAVKEQIKSLAGVDVAVTKLDDDRQRLEDERSEIDARRRRILDLAERGHLDVEEAGRRLDALASRREAVESMLKMDTATFTLSFDDAEVFAAIDDPRTLRGWLQENVTEIVWTRSTKELVLRF
jgi:DNA invertase Pin-like site-specific DNA recombinase